MEAVLSPLRRVGMLLDHGKVCASLGTEDLPGTSDSDSAALLRQLQGWLRTSSDLIFLEDTSREEAQRLLVDHAEAERAFTLLLTVLDESADESLRLRCSVAVVDIWKRRPFTREVCENRYHAAPFPDLPRLLRTAERVGEAAPALRNFLSLLYYRRHWIDRTVRRWAGLDPGLFEIMGKDLSRERAVDHGLFRRFALALAMAEAPADFVNRELPGLSAAGFSDASRWLKEWAEMEDVQEPTRGRDLLGAFVQWGRHHSSNQIFISERVVKEDIYTSIHIAEFDVAARDTKLGPEEITRDIPDVGEEALKNLDHDGIVRIGAEVMPGDILVGKITPKSEAELAPEERLLRAIFGEEAAEVKDTSLRVPSGCIGIVQDIQISSHSNGRKRAEKVKPMELEEKADKVTEDLTEKLSEILLGEKIPLDVVDAQTGEIIIPANREITETLLRKLASAHDHIEIDPSPLRNKILETISSFEGRFQELDSERERELDRPEAGDDVGPVITEVKVFIAAKHKLSVGDKMAGRYGNEGVVATIVPEEDMPYLADGTPVDIVLHPLGVPSRMNVGQVLEKDISIGGKSLLLDGRTGDAFHQPVVVGVISMLKLGHLVADKIPGRAVGPYSLATQQPLGGKAPYGGQRFGEMEVGALETYGAAYTPQELLTVKSDDVQGRTRIYEAIVKGDNNLGAGTPESFNVLIKEMQSLGLDVCPGKHGSERGAAPSSEDAAQYDPNYSS